jgi:CheY-like chemotaxis protein
MSSGRCTVVVVDDDDAMREVIAGAIRSDGYRVITASNGEEALDALETLVRPCVVLLDLMMPVKSGWDVLREMNRRPLLAAIPVVVLTACGSEQAAGPADLGRPVVQKPIDCDALLALVDELCAQEEGLFEALREPPRHLIPGPYAQGERRGVRS